MQKQRRGRLAAIAAAVVPLVATRGRAHMARMFVSSQAPHTLAGNKQFSWKVRWAAPDPGAGPVTFYLAGNVVNGNCRPDPGDLWSVASGLVVAQAGA